MSFCTTFLGSEYKNRKNTYVSIKRERVYLCYRIEGVIGHITPLNALKPISYKWHPFKKGGFEFFYYVRNKGSSGKCAIDRIFQVKLFR